MSEIQDTAARIEISRDYIRNMERHGVAEETIRHYIEQKEDEIILMAVKQVERGDYITLRRPAISRTDYPDNVHFDLRIHVTRPEQIRVFVPVTETRAMPKDTHRCQYCSGYTYNDRRGNCAACGAPRHTRD